MTACFEGTCPQDSAAKWGKIKDKWETKLAHMHQAMLDEYDNTLLGSVYLPVFRRESQGDQSSGLKATAHLVLPSWETHDPDDVNLQRNLSHGILRSQLLSWMVQEQIMLILSYQGRNL